ncbi:MAG: hypothetical protein MJ103_05055 [Saccharofermentans sp.]|nr:hypothetical protein [Saccharofermentans sp.]
MKKEIKSIVAVSLSLLISCLSTGCVPQTRPTSYNPSEYSSVASEIIDSMQNGEHGLDSDMPWFTDIHGYADNGIYSNEKLQFSVEVPDNWHVLTLNEMMEYGDSEETRREILNIDDDPILWGHHEVYDFMCADDSGHRISVLLIHEGYLQYDTLYNSYLNEIIRDSRTELELDPTATRVTHDNANIVEFNDQLVYMINWTIYHEDGSETYRTEIIDFYPPATRVIALEYTSPDELEDLMGCISYQSVNEYPDTDSTTHTMATT